MAQSENVHLAAQSGQSNRSSACSPALGDPSVVCQIEQYCAALEAGRNPDRQELISRYPQIADELAACLHGLEAVHQFGPQFREHAADAARDTARSADLPKVGMLGDFRILREIGRGGMGVVYEAEQVSLGRRVALKVLPFAAVLDPKQLQRFKNEAQAATSLDHPNIVGVYSVGCERGVHYYAMEYIEGQTLAEVIAGLRQGAGGEDPHLWITDFGLVITHTKTNLTMTGDLLGTLRYMSPQQVQARHGVLDHRTDVYSLGLTLYELLALQPAFPGADRQKLIRQAAEDDPRPPRRLNSAIPRDLETIILKATAKEPQSRYGTAQGFADDLRRFLEDEPIQARRASLVERTRKWSRRHRPVVRLAAVMMMVMTIGYHFRMKAQSFDRSLD